MVADAGRCGPGLLVRIPIPLAGPRMRFVIDAGEVLKIKVGIDLRRADIGVTQQFLHPPQVSAGLQKVRGEGMAQQVRAHACIQPDLA